MIRRTGVFYLGVAAAMIGLIFRIFGLSVGDNAFRAETVYANREGHLTLYRTKGLIYDENLIPLAGGQPCRYLVVNPRDFPKENIVSLAQLCGVDHSVLLEKLKKETPFVLKTFETPEEMTGIHIFEGVSRYSGVAQHLLGYLDSADEVGMSGIEKEYDQYLDLFAETVSVRYKPDAIRGAIAGLGVEECPSEITQNGVVLTLNEGLCRELERSMDEHIEKGAGIIMDCQNGEIKAIASRPGYNESKLFEYMDSTEGELINRALSAQTVGSVFKMIVAACALEKNVEDFKFFCDGGIMIGEHTFACHEHSGHGEVLMKEAFAQSCNAYFIALGQLLGYECLSEMANRFGYGKSIELLGSIKASGGNVPDQNGNLSLANFCIGQGELTASPMQISVMTAVIANGGILIEPSIYKGLFLNGNLKDQSQPKEGRRILSAEHAEKLKEFCIYTVESGTGKNAKPEIGSAGGKTSSAQTGIVENGKEKLNVYFTGFYPAEEPRYAITVFAEDGISGGKTCAPVFRSICDYIAQTMT